MAVLLSSLVIVMVAGIFLAQNRSYLVQLGVTDAHHNARAVTELLSSELRLVMEGGVLLAENDEITVRTPIVVAVVCASDGVVVGVHSEGGEAAIETRAQEVAGFAVMDGGGGGTTTTSIGRRSTTGARAASLPGPVTPTGLTQWEPAATSTPSQTSAATIRRYLMSAR